MRGKSWRRPLSALCVALLVLAAGAGWASPGDLGDASNAELIAAIGGCHALGVCHYASACSNTPDGLEGFGTQSTYFYYKYGSAAYNFEGGAGTCREHLHYTALNCASGYQSALDTLFSVCP